MDDPELMRAPEAVADLHRELDRLWPAHSPLLGDPRRQRLAAHALHHHVRAVGRQETKVEDRHHVRMIDLGQQLGLAPQSLARLGIAHSGVEDLDGNLAWKREVFSLPDHAHPAGTDLRAELVATAEDLLLW